MNLIQYLEELINYKEELTLHQEEKPQLVVQVRLIIHHLIKEIQAKALKRNSRHIYQEIIQMERLRLIIISKIRDHYQGKETIQIKSLLKEIKIRILFKLIKILETLHKTEVDQIIIDNQLMGTKEIINIQDNNLTIKQKVVFMIDSMQADRDQKK